MQERRRVKPGVIWLLQNKASEKYLHVPGGVTGSSRLIQWPDDRAPNSRWHIMPVSPGDTDTAYWIVGARSGLPVSPYDGSANDGDIEQGQRYTLNSQWEFIPYSDDHVIVQSVGSRKCLTTKAYDDNIQQWGFENSTNSKDHRLWRLVKYREVSDFKMPDGYGGKPPEIGSPPKPSDTAQTPESTTEVLVASALLPLMAVQDDNSREWQAENCPYYVLERWGYWKLSLYVGAPTSQERVSKVTFGLTTKNSRQVSEKTGISVTAECGFALNGFSASLKSTFEKEIGVTTVSEEGKNFESTVEVSRKLDSSTGRKLAVWHRGDHYIVKRLGGRGTKVVEWRTLKSNIEETTILR
ncbi:RICIN domain-containing protein [Amycolatopsis sp. NPDC051045]|uniref:RICIN domain-containing protein n=1 Tax=Amycolatopsis sp. NPDC051045 TaxID=3156922 RepID=UPI00341DFE32